MVFNLLSKIKEYLENGTAFSLKFEDAECHVLSKATSYSQQVMDAVLFFQYALRDLKLQPTAKAKKLKSGLLELHSLWLEQLKGEEKNLPDTLCALALFRYDLCFYAKYSYSEWLCVKNRDVFEKNTDLYESLNFRIDIGVYITIESLEEDFLVVPLKKLQKRSIFAKNATFSGFDLYFQQKAILQFDKKGRLKGQYHCVDGALKVLL